MKPSQNPAPPVIITPSPHVHCGSTVSKAMRDVLLALLPAVLASLWFFRLQGLTVIIACCLSAVFFEAVCQKVMNRPVTIKDGSALLTGLLLALCLPPALSPLLAAFGGFCAIVIGKQVFGGLGNNIFNPAHIGRAILLASMPQQMTTWTPPAASFGSVGSAAYAQAVSSATWAAKGADAVSSATPLALLRTSEALWQKGGAAVDALPPLQQMFFGNIPGSLGETSVPAILLGGLFLIWRGHVDWRIPVYYLLTVFVITGAYGFFHGYPASFPFYHLFGGGLMIGAFFMATDWVTSPLTKRGRIIFALGLGLLTALIRLRGGFVEGVCYSILLMNMLTPLIDRYVHIVPFGGGRRRKDEK